MGCEDPWCFYYNSIESDLPLMRKLRTRIVNQPLHSPGWTKASTGWTMDDPSSYISFNLCRPCHWQLILHMVWCLPSSHLYCYDQQPEKGDTREEAFCPRPQGATPHLGEVYAAGAQDSWCYHIYSQEQREMRVHALPTGLLVFFPLDMIQNIA